MTSFVWFLCFAAVLVTGIESSNILVVYPSPSKSNILNGKVLFHALAERGHNVTVLSNFPFKETVRNYRDVYIPISKEVSDFILNSTHDLSDTFRIRQKLSVLTLQNEEVITIMNEESFDLVIFGYALNDFLLGFGAHFNCPIIVMWANAHIQPLNDLVGNPIGNSYIPNFASGSKGPMTFSQRVKNAYLNTKIALKFWWLSNQNRKAYNFHFGKSKNFPSFDEMKKNVSLVFVTSHFTQGVLRPNQPNIIEIGGIKAMEKKQSLNSEYQEFLDSAESGAIFMSLGTNVNSSSLSTEKLTSILKSFRKLKQKIIWKWENETLEGQPDNVKIAEWLPQEAILAHPNVKLFISHGGLGSITEAKFHGVPVLGIPISKDQPTNLKVIEKEGWAVTVSFENLTEVSLSEGVHRILSNPRYHDKVQKISKLFKDRPISPLDTAIYWTEYVIRYQGAKHLQSPAVHLNFFQVNSLDVWVVLLVVCLVWWKVQNFVLKMVWRRFFDQRK